MKLLRELSPKFALAGIVALQISCGDSSGPGNSAATIAANSSTTLAAAPGTQVAELPSVVVRDQNGAAVGGVHVTFTVTSGGGSITGGNATSNASGIATVGSWTLGTTPGVNTLTATTGSLPAITFTAQSADPCAFQTTHTLGTTTTGQLSTSDCRLSDGSFADLYEINIATAGTYIFTQTSSAFDTYLWLLTPGLTFLGVNDDVASNDINSRIKVLMPAGNYVLAANSFDPNITGSYALTSAASTAEVTNCEDVFVIRGITSTQSLQTTDCLRNNIYADEYLLFLPQGQAVTVTMSSSAVDSYLEFFADGNTSNVLASNDNIDGTTQDARFTFTAVSTAFYIIRARTTAGGITGAYTLTVQ